MLMLPALITLAGCSKDNPGDDGQITLPNQSEKTQQAFADEETTGGFSFTAKSAWSASVAESAAPAAVVAAGSTGLTTPARSNALTANNSTPLSTAQSRAGGLSWLRLLLNGQETYSGGAGSFTLTIELDPNYTGATRSASITITCGTDKITISVTQEGKTEAGVVPEDPNPVTGISLNKNTLELAVGASETLTATIAPVNATIKTVNWSSGDPTVATVDAVSGLVTAVKAGTATITATSSSTPDVSGSCAVTVTGGGNEEPAAVLRLAARDIYEYVSSSDVTHVKAVAWPEIVQPSPGGVIDDGEQTGGPGARSVMMTRTTIRSTIASRSTDTEPQVLAVTTYNKTDKSFTIDLPGTFPSALLYSVKDEFQSGAFISSNTVKMGTLYIEGHSNSSTTWSETGWIDDFYYEDDGSVYDSKYVYFTEDVTITYNGVDEKVAITAQKGWNLIYHYGIGDMYNVSTTAPSGASYHWVFGEPDGDGGATLESVTINGVKWATRNVDAFGTFAGNPNDYGMFYQWNRSTAWPSTDATVTGWNATIPTGDSWESTNDPCPEGWRIPTTAEHGKLFDNTYVSNEWTTLYGANGRKFTDLETGQFVFFPAAGSRYNSDGSLDGSAGNAGYYWSSSPYSGSTGSAWSLNLGSDSGNAYQGDYGRLAGLSVRCVGMTR